MKVSKEQKLETRQAILRAAVEIIIEKGIKSATMRQIAKNAGIADATIYNYFPAKEDIPFAYYEDHLQDCVHALEQLPDVQAYTFQEYLQAFFDISLERYLADREFVAITFKNIFFSMSHNFGRLKPIRDIFLSTVKQRFETAVASEELPDCFFQEVISQLFLDFYVVVIMYWLSDRSRGFSNTMVLVDRSLDLICAGLKSGLIDKFFDIAMFLFKNHVLSRLDFFGERFDTFREMKASFFRKKS